MCPPVVPREGVSADRRYTVGNGYAGQTDAAGEGLSADCQNSIFLYLNWGGQVLCRRRCNLLY